MNGGWGERERERESGRGIVYASGGNVINNKCRRCPAAAASSSTIDRRYGA